jgi:hypothetical protein
MMTVYCHAQIACDSGPACRMTYTERHQSRLSNGEAEGVGRTKLQAIREATGLAKSLGWELVDGRWQCKACANG